MDENKSFRNAFLLRKIREMIKLLARDNCPVGRDPYSERPLTKAELEGLYSLIGRFLFREEESKK